MNKSWRWISIGALAVIVAVAALQVARSSFASGFFASPTADLSHTNWSLVSINGQAPITGRALTLKFQSGTQLAGDSGCNSYGAQYQVRSRSATIVYQKLEAADYSRFCWLSSARNHRASTACPTRPPGCAGGRGRAYSRDE